jgi:hypothetical protein
MRLCLPDSGRHGQGGSRQQGGRRIARVVVLTFLVALLLVQACGGRQEPVQLVTHDVRPDTVPCAVGPSWELPPAVIGERPAVDDGLRLSWCAEPEGSGGLQLPLMAPQRRALDEGTPRQLP